jgi:hypothetical protein
MWSQAWNCFTPPEAKHDIAIGAVMCGVTPTAWAVTQSTAGTPRHGDLPAFIIVVYVMLHYCGL